MEQHRKWYFMYADEFNRLCFIMSVLAPISFLFGSDDCICMDRHQTCVWHRRPSFFFFCLDAMLQFKRRKSSTLFEFLFRLWESASSWWISDFVTTCAVLTVNVQMVVGGCRLTLFARALCNLATTSRLAEQHFNWSHFCQTRQAKTHLRIQGVPADTHPPARTHYSDDIPGNLLISREHWRSSPRLIGFFHNSDQRLNKRRFQALFTLS